MSDEVLRKVGSRIRRMRKETGLTQERFAELAHLDRSYYGRVERGAQNLSITTICSVARVLGVAPSVVIADLTLSDCQNASQTED